MNKPTIYSFYRKFLMLVIGSFISFHHTTFAESEVSLTLLRNNVVELLLAGEQDLPLSEQQRSLQNWLVGPPVLNFSALKSNDVNGTDEYEVALDFLIRRPDLLNQQDYLHNLGSAIETLQTKQLNLFASGLVRQHLWAYLQAKLEVDILERKRAWLTEIEQQLVKQQQSGESSKLAMLTWAQHQLDIERELIAAQATLASRKVAFAKLTGSDSIPEQYVETSVNDIDASLNQHPEIRLLAMQREFQQRLFEFNTKQQGNWQLSVIGRKLSNPLGDESQFGISVGIPLTIEGRADISEQHDWRQTDYDLSQALYTLRSSLYERLNQAHTEANQLRQQLDLLARQVELSDEIVVRMTQLQRVNELDQVRWLESLLAQQSRRNELARITLQLNQITAQINQLSGQPL